MHVVACSATGPHATRTPLPNLASQRQSSPLGFRCVPGAMDRPEHVKLLVSSLEQDFRYPSCLHQQSHFLRSEIHGMSAFRPSTSKTSEREKCGTYRKSDAAITWHPADSAKTTTVLVTNLKQSYIFTARPCPPLAEKPVVHMCQEVVEPSPRTLWLYPQSAEEDACTPGHYCPDVCLTSHQ